MLSYVFLHFPTPRDSNGAWGDRQELSLSEPDPFSSQVPKSLLPNSSNSTQQDLSPDFPFCNQAYLCPQYSPGVKPKAVSSSRRPLMVLGKTREGVCGEM